VPQYDDQRRTESFRGKLDATDLGRRNDVACHPNHEEIAKTLVEYDFGGDPSVGTPQHDGDRRLLCRAWCPVCHRIVGSSARDEAGVTLSQAFECVLR
jgi:hypothetical protein